MRVDANNVIAKHFVHIKTGDGLEQYTLTGVVIVSLAGHRGDWRREQVDFPLVIPIIPAGKTFSLKHWAPLVTINAIDTVDDQGGDQHRGYAVDSFRILDARALSNVIIVQSDVAIRDVDSTLHRLGYNVTLVGEYVDRNDNII